MADMEGTQVGKAARMEVDMVLHKVLEGMAFRKVEGMAFHMAEGMDCAVVHMAVGMALHMEEGMA